MNSELDQLGPRLRAERQARGLTLEELAADAGMSMSTLSRLESGKRQASLELLLPLTKRLGVTIDDLLSRGRIDPRVRKQVQHHDGHVIESLSPGGSPTRTYKITYPPRDELPALRVHDGYEWLYVLSGKLRLRLGEQDLVLGRGEAAEFDTRVPHALSATGGRAAQVISIFNEAGVRLHTHVGERGETP